MVDSVTTATSVEDSFTSTIAVVVSTNVTGRLTRNIALVELVMILDCLSPGGVLGVNVLSVLGVLPEPDVLSEPGVLSAPGVLSELVGKIIP